MPRKKPRLLPCKRKRQGKTNYRKRLRLLLAKKPRLVLRLTNQKIIAQITDYQGAGDIVLVGLDSSLLKKYGWSFSLKNLPAAYLTGYLLGRKALQKNIEEAILDLGFRPPLPGNRLYACLKGVLDAGLKIPHSPEIFPSPERISGQHILAYAQKGPNKITETFLKVKKELELAKNNRLKIPKAIN